MAENLAVVKEGGEGVGQHPAHRQQHRRPIMVLMHRRGKRPIAGFDSRGKGGDTGQELAVARRAASHLSGNNSPSRFSESLPLKCK